MRSCHMLTRRPSHVRGRSGKEGCYPQLLELAEKRLVELKPDRFVVETHERTLVLATGCMVLLCGAARRCCGMCLLEGCQN